MSNPLPDQSGRGGETFKPTGRWGFLPSRRGQLYTWAIVFEPRDWWLGLYRDPDKARIFICVVPCFPVLIGRLKHPGPGRAALDERRD